MAKRGRPAFKPTTAQRRTVRELKSTGETDERIADALAIDPDTLRKHLRPELDRGLSIQRREIVGMLYASARSGNVSAMKRLEELSRSVGAAEHFAEPAPSPRAAAPGKKEAADRAAQTAGAGSDWGDDLSVPGNRPN